MSDLHLVELPYTETLSKMEEIEVKVPMSVYNKFGEKASGMIKGWEDASLYHLQVDGAFKDIWVIIKPVPLNYVLDTDWFLFTASKFVTDIGITKLRLEMSGTRYGVNSIALNKSLDLVGNDGFDTAIMRINVIRESYKLYSEKNKMSPEEREINGDRLALKELTRVKEHIAGFKSEGLTGPIGIPSSLDIPSSGLITKEGGINFTLPSYYYLNACTEEGKIVVRLHYFKYRKVFDTFDPEAIVEFVKESRVRALTDPRMTNFRKRCDDVVLSRNKENSGEGTLSSKGPMTDDEVMKMIGEERK